MFGIFWLILGEPSFNGWWVNPPDKQKLTHRQTDTHTHKDAGNDNTRRPKGPRVKIRLGQYNIYLNSNIFEKKSSHEINEEIPVLL